MPDPSVGRNEDSLIGVREAARHLGLHENTIRNWEKAGLLTAVKLGAARYRRFSREDIERMGRKMLTQLAPATEMPARREAGDLSDAVPSALRRLPVAASVDVYVARVVKDWESQWAGRPEHRYGRDFHAFLGERLLTDFNLRHHDRTRGAD